MHLWYTFRSVAERYRIGESEINNFGCHQQHHIYGFAYPADPMLQKIINVIDDFIFD